MERVGLNKFKFLIMKKLSLNSFKGNKIFTELKEVSGGITCKEYTEVLQYLSVNNPRQFQAHLETYSMFGHGGTVEMQFESGGEC